MAGLDGQPLDLNAPNANAANQQAPAVQELTVIQQRLRQLVFDRNFTTRPIDIRDHSYVYVNFAMIDVLVGYVDSKIETNRYFKFDYDFHGQCEYLTFAAILYNHIVTAIHIMRIMRQEGTLKPQDARFLDRFLEIYPENTIPIDGVMFLFLKTIQTSDPQDQNRFHSVIPTMSLPSAAAPLTRNNAHLLPDMLQYTQTDWIGLMRIFLALSKNVDYTNPTYNLVSDDQNPNPIEVPIHSTAGGTNRRSQQMCLRPGFTQKVEAVPEFRRNRWRPAMRHMANYIKTPNINLQQDFTSFEQVIGFDIDPLFFGRLRQFLNKRLAYVHEVKTLNRVPTGRSSHILFDVKVQDLTDSNIYNQWFTAERVVSDEMKATANWPTTPAVPNPLLVANASYQFMLENVSEAGRATIPIVSLAEFMYDNFPFVMAHESQAYTSEENLSEEQGQEALALRTYTTSLVPHQWRPGVANTPHRHGPYFEDTNHQWRTTPTLSTSGNVINVLDQAYRTGRGEPPFPIE
jgi:hypothetical protein